MININRLVNNTTAVGKTGKAVIYLVVSTVVMAVLSTIVHNPQLFSVQTVAGANIVLVLVRNILDSNVPNI